MNADDLLGFDTKLDLSPYIKIVTKPSHIYSLKRCFLDTGIKDNMQNILHDLKKKHLKYLFINLLGVWGADVSASGAIWMISFIYGITGFSILDL